MGVMKEFGLQVRGDRRSSGREGEFARIKSLFFDRPAVIRMMDSQTRKVLNHFGGLTMRIARNSIKSRDAISAPGSPPSSHVGANNRRIRAAAKKAGLASPKLSRGVKEIYYSYDPQTRSVVIGPIAFNSSELSKTSRRVGSNITTLELLEYGGTVMRQVAEVNFAGERYWISSPNILPRPCHYRPRPFMGPAFDIAIDKLPAMWAGGVK